MHDSECKETVFLKDTDERACAYIAGPVPNCWEFIFEGKNLLESVINLSASGKILQYSDIFELFTFLYDRLNLGWYVISVTSTPGKVHKDVDTCKNVLRGLHSNQIAPRELDRVRRMLLMRHEAEIKSNAYWLGLMAQLQLTSVPKKDRGSVPVMEEGEVVGLGATSGQVSSEAKAARRVERVVQRSPPWMPAAWRRCRTA
ncbi:hypothetical protein ACS0TY_033245 [Phlomoides rotata]